MSARMWPMITNVFVLNTSTCIKFSSQSRRKGRLASRKRLDFLPAATLATCDPYPVTHRRTRPLASGQGTNRPRKIRWRASTTFQASTRRYRTCVRDVERTGAFEVELVLEEPILFNKGGSVIFEGRYPVAGRDGALFGLATIDSSGWFG